MTLFSAEPVTVRPIMLGDMRYINRLLDTAWRVYSRVPVAELRRKVQKLPLAFLARDATGIRGFLIAEPHHPDTLLIVAAGLRDTWGMRPFFRALLPALEQAGQNMGLKSLVYIGNAAWLSDALLMQGFQVAEQMIVYERYGLALPVAPATQHILLRTAHYRDLAALITLDRLAFEGMWRKTVDDFSQALAFAHSFLLAEVDGVIAGYEWCEVHDQHAHLTRIAVHPQYQQQGVGSQLLYRAIAAATAQGATQITLNTQESNRRSRALYQRFGFVDTRVRLPVMEKSLIVNGNGH